MTSDQPRMKGERQAVNRPRATRETLSPRRRSSRLCCRPGKLGAWPQKKQYWDCILRANEHWRLRHRGRPTRPMAQVTTGRAVGHHLHIRGVRRIHRCIAVKLHPTRAGGRANFNPLRPRHSHQHPRCRWHQGHAQHRDDRDEGPTLEATVDGLHGAMSVASAQ